MDNNLEIYDFDGSKEAFNELCEMNYDLMNYSEDSYSSYAISVKDLIDQLSKNGSICKIIKKNEETAGFIVLLPDEKGGVLAQSLYLKEKFRKTQLFYKTVKHIESIVNENFKNCVIIATNRYIESIYEKMYKKRYSVFVYEAR